LHKSHSACEAGVSISLGRKPQVRSQRQAGARENGRQREIPSLSPAIAGSGPFIWHVNLGLAPQALCLRLLSQAKKYHSISTFCAKPVFAEDREFARAVVSKLAHCVE